MYAVDVTNLMVVKITTGGLLTVVAGNGKKGSGGDGGLATSASFLAPGALAADAAGNLFIADECAIRKIGADGIISTIAGLGRCAGYSGDGGAATQASLSAAGGLAVDTKGNVYIADTLNYRIRKVTPQGIISTVAGNGRSGETGDNGPAINAALFGPTGVAADSNGVIYFTEGSHSSRIRRVDTDGVISTVAGNGAGYSGDGGPATAAMLRTPNAIALDSSGDIYVCDMLNHRLREITPDGIIRTIAGTGVASFTGDEGPATLATLAFPIGIAIDVSGNMYFGDALNLRVRKIDPAGTISTYAGSGDYGFLGDGGQARDAVLNSPWDVLVDPSGMFIFPIRATTAFAGSPPTGSSPRLRVAVPEFSLATAARRPKHY